MQEQRVDSREKYWATKGKVAIGPRPGGSTKGSVDWLSRMGYTLFARPAAVDAQTSHTQLKVMRPQTHGQRVDGKRVVRNIRRRRAKWRLHQTIGGLALQDRQNTVFVRPAAGGGGQVKRYGCFFRLFNLEITFITANSAKYSWDHLKATNNIITRKSRAKILHSNSQLRVQVRTNEILTPLPTSQMMQPKS